MAICINGHELLMLYGGKKDLQWRCPEPSCNWYTEADDMVETWDDQVPWFAYDHTMFLTMERASQEVGRIQIRLDDTINWKTRNGIQEECRLRNIEALEAQLEIIRDLATELP